MDIKFNLPSPLQEYSFNKISFLLKRDDLIHPLFSGNKARKIDYLLNTPLDKYDKIVSYGSLFSNAMLSLAIFSKIKNIPFYYLVKNLSKKELLSPKGNLKIALSNGMILKDYRYLQDYLTPNALFIKEGISNKFAYIGVEKLAKELIKELLPNKNYQIFLPSGTGTTSLFLSKALIKLNKKNIKVFTTPVVGDKNYLLEQFRNLEKDSSFYPTILDTSKRYGFGRLYKEFYQIWLELYYQTKVEFDLLYDPKGWITILENSSLFENLVYIHQGGNIGNITMIERYQRRWQL